MSGMQTLLLRNGIGNAVPEHPAAGSLLRQERSPGLMDIAKFSSRFSVRRLTDDDAEIMYELCTGNPLYYRYSRGNLDRSAITADLHIAPPGIGPKDKYYVGFFEGSELAAMLDLIDGYPGKGIAFIGFFMMSEKKQGRNTGTEIISELLDYLRGAGFAEVHLGIDRGNPQSAHFWKKNGFKVTREISDGEHGILYAEKKLRTHGENGFDEVNHESRMERHS